MFPKAKEENQPKDPLVNEEVKAENIIAQPIGNQGARVMPPVDPGAGNESMNAQIVNQVLNIINDQEQEPQGEAPEQAPKPDIFYDQMEQKPLFYQDPEEKPEQAAEPKIETLNDLLNAIDNSDPISEDLIANRPKRKRIKKSKKKKKSGADNDINQVNNEMKAIGGLNFNVQKLPERAKTSGWRRFLTGTANFFGSTLGKAINVVQNIFRGTYWSSKYRQSQSNDMENHRIPQDKRSHDLIPGWEGKRFEKEPGGEDDILADFRRVPTVWSYVTAGKAVDAQGRPLPPKISVNVNQAKEGVDQTMSGLDMGHSGLGLEYSRYSQISGRYERYALKYGYYMAGANLGMTSLGSTRGGRFPGQLMNEKDSSYTIIRTFPAKTRQINDILKASETYADGGYNGLTRNCTSFVKEMVQNVAHLPLPSNIFKMENPSVSSLGNFGVFTGAAHDTNAKISAENRLEELGQQEDMSYAGLGNKRVTKQDYRNYKQHQNDQNTVHSLADIPNAVAENMRRLEGKGSGIIKSTEYQGTIADLENPAKLPDYINAVKSEQAKLRDAILKVTGKRDLNELFASISQSPDAMMLIAGIQNSFQPLTGLMAKLNDPNAMRKARAELDDQIENLNKLLFDVFGNDKRLHIPVVHMISLLENAKDYIDTQYGKIDYGADNDGELANLRSQVKFNKYNARTGEDINIMMTPSHYEAYIQIYKDPDTAIRKYSEYAKLLEIKQNKTRKLTSREKGELSKSERIEKLADQFDRAHDYMLEKTSYTQQDVDYVFSLGEKEMSGNAGGDIIANSASKVYKTLILEKIFGGMTQRFLNHFSDPKAIDMEKIVSWLDNDIYTCMNRKKDEVLSVMKAMRRNASDGNQNNPEVLEGWFYGLMQEFWFYQILNSMEFPENSPLNVLSENIQESWATISSKNDSHTHVLIKSLIDQVCSDDGVMN